jgi:hypothetical protein
MPCAAWCRVRPGTHAQALLGMHATVTGRAARPAVPAMPLWSYPGAVAVSKDEAPVAGGMQRAQPCAPASQTASGYALRSEVPGSPLVMAGIVAATNTYCRRVRPVRPSGGGGGVLEGGVNPGAWDNPAGPPAVGDTMYMGTA